MLTAQPGRFDLPRRIVEFARHLQPPPGTHGPENFILRLLCSLHMRLFSIVHDDVKFECYRS